MESQIHCDRMRVVHRAAHEKSAPHLHQRISVYEIIGEEAGEKEERKGWSPKKRQEAGSGEKDGV